MAKKRRKTTPGQDVWLALYRADLYDEKAKGMVVPPNAAKHNVERVTRRWLEGMSRHLKEAYSTQLRREREKLGLTQQELAEKAELTVTAVAMIERKERIPNLDTAARLCWALDVAAGVLHGEVQ